MSKRDAEVYARMEYEQYEIPRRAFKESIGEGETIKRLEEAARELNQKEESQTSPGKKGSK